MKNCTDCAYAVMDDFGYSNYTVEGTTFYCGLKLHPEDGFDRWYGEDKRLGFADECKDYKKGDCVWIDVDAESVNSESDDPDVKWKEYATADVDGRMIESVLK